MNDVPRIPGDEPASLVQCPRCRGRGRYGPTDAACVICWCSGMIEHWRWQQLMDDEARRGTALRRTGRAARKDADKSAESADSAEPHDAAAQLRRAGLTDPCVKCAPTERCDQCPFGPFVLAA